VEVTAAVSAAEDAAAASAAVTEPTPEKNEKEGHLLADGPFFWNGRQSCRWFDAKLNF